MPKGKKLSLTMPAKTLERFERLKRLMELNDSKLVSRALALLERCAQVTANGGTIILKYPDDTEVELDIHA